MSQARSPAPREFRIKESVGRKDNDAASWMTIKTPEINKLMAEQDFDEEAKFWIAAHWGRMMFTPSDLDNHWQIIYHLTPSK